MEEEDQRPCPSPAPAPFSSTLRDISNFKTPKRPSRISNFHSPYPQFFTASKQTPSSSSSAFRHHLRRPSLAPSATRSNATRRLKAFELEQSQSSRKAQIQKEKSLRSLAKSLTVWLNFLFESPELCGCDMLDLSSVDSGKLGLANGKREGWPGGGVAVDGQWRSPKRQRDCFWLAADEFDTPAIPNSMFLSLQSSLQEICSFDDLKQRMSVYLSLGSCKEIFKMMTQVTKNIDERRLKMKPHCPMVTDVGMKEKAINILMCYNPIWLRIGLYIIFGGDSLLPNGDVSSEQELAFLRMIVEKQFFLHAGLAKAYAYNKWVDGLYRPGYFEALGNIILKRFLLLVLMLDRAKSQNSLPIKYGIDGLDGGSPLLFTRQSNIKSSQEMINDFLSADVMHGEGNLLAHLVIVGYKVSYWQCPLIEYNFRVTDLFEELRDGLQLCRAIQLLRHDSSILTKMVVPSDTRKKNLVNCGIVLQYLKQAGVPLYDEDGVEIVGDDLANGDKELTLFLLWNMFVHLQVPFLINKSLLSEEISKIHRVDMNLPKSDTSTHLEMLLNWIQAICKSYDIQIDNYASLVDGKAMWCLLDYYFRKELHCFCLYKDADEVNGEDSIVSAADYTNAVHNFILSQKLTTLLGNFPEVLQISDLLEYNSACNEKSVVILLVFLSFQLVVKKNKDQLNFHKLLGCKCQSSERKHSRMNQSSLRCKPMLNQGEKEERNSEDAMRKFKAIQAWWQKMTELAYKHEKKSEAYAQQHFLSSTLYTKIQGENAAKVIQSHFRGLVERRNYYKIKNAVFFLQIVIHAWVKLKQMSVFNKCKVNSVLQPSFVYCTERQRQQSEVLRRYIMYLVDRHSFVKLRRSALLIQQAVRTWISRRHYGSDVLNCDISLPDIVNAAIVVQTCIRGWIARSRYMLISQIRKSLICKEKVVNDLHIKAAVKIQLGWKKYIASKYICNRNSAATVIQSHFRSWWFRRSFEHKKRAILKIQSNFRFFMYWRAFQKHKVATNSAIIIQSHIRGWITQRKARRLRYLIVSVQSHCRGWSIRRSYLFQRQAAIQIQSALRCINCRETFHHYRHAAFEIQRFVRGQISRNRLLGASSLRGATSSCSFFWTSRVYLPSFELKIFLCSVLKLQRWWKGVMLLRSKEKSAIIIQSHVRRWMVRQATIRQRCRVVVVQSYWKGYLARKESRGKLLELRLRVQKSATNVDDGMRLINRLVAALSELLTMRSVSGILHTCATLDMATEHSQKCCEKLVAAGAIHTLLKLICSVSRSIPDQEVLKHALSTLRNLARYPHLVEVLINSPRSVEIILWEFLRNKEEGYFIASELLKKICSKQEGVEAVKNFPALLKRLQNLVEDLTRKANKEKRNARAIVIKESTERRLKEALDLLKLTNG